MGDYSGGRGGGGSSTDALQLGELSVLAEDQPSEFGPVNRAVCCHEDSVSEGLVQLRVAGRAGSVGSVGKLIVVDDEVRDLKRRASCQDAGDDCGSG